MRLNFTKDVIRLIKLLSVTRNNDKILECGSFDLSTLDSVCFYLNVQSKLGQTSSIYFNERMLQTIFTTAFYKVLLSYINDNNLGDKVVEEVKHGLNDSYQNIGYFYLRNFAQHVHRCGLKEGELTIELIIDYYCYFFAPTYIGTETCSDKLVFNYMFDLTRTKDGDRYWHNHESAFIAKINKLTPKDILKLQLL